MTTDLPPSSAFSLPEDPALLASLHDQLSDYLATLERNTDAIDTWLKKNHDNIMIGHHQLVRALSITPDEKAAIAVLDNLGECAGFVLSMQEFDQMAKNAFGPNNAFLAKAEALKNNLPPDLLEDLPEIKIPEPAAKEEEGKAIRVSTAKPAPQKKGALASIASWFRKEKATAIEEEVAPQEDLKKVEDRRRQWKILRGELVALQSDRHYYIDSYMDWLVEMVEPASAESAANADKLMQQYEDPRYVIRLAQEDYMAVLHGRVDALKKQALEYSALAELIDRQDIPRFIGKLSLLFPIPDTNESLHTRKLLLQDFKVASFAELALTQVQDRGAQHDLLVAALRHEKNIVMSQQKTPADIFAFVFDQVVDNTAPLSSAALSSVLMALRNQWGENYNLPDIMGLAKGSPTVFERIAHRFAQDSHLHRCALDMFVSRNDVDHFMDFKESLNKKNHTNLVQALNNIATSSTVEKVLALWHLSYPGKSVVEALMSCAGPDTSKRASILSMAMEAGLVGEVEVNRHQALHVDKTSPAAFITKYILPDFPNFSLSVLRRLLGTAYAQGGLDDLRHELTKPQGWLADIINRPNVPEPTRLNWIAALLEPFANDIVRANILFDAAVYATDMQTEQILKALEKNLMGQNIRLDDDTLMINTDRISNAFYNAEQECLHYIINGIDKIMAPNVTPTMASEIITLLHRRGNFEKEYLGLFRPETVDYIETTLQKTSIAWNLHKTDLNIEEGAAARLHTRTDFLHEDKGNGHWHSVNLSSIALLQPLTDGTYLLIDKFGNPKKLTGKITLPKKLHPLLDLDGALFNPQQAGIINLVPASNTLKFRLESKEFDKLLKDTGNDNLFFNVELTPKALDKLEKTLQADDMVAQTTAAGYSHFYFNLRALGYMMFQEGRDNGFACWKQGNRKTGFVNVDPEAAAKSGGTHKSGFVNTDPDLAQQLLFDLAANSRFVTIGEMVTHSDNIEDAYYNQKQKKLFVVIGNDILHVSCPPEIAYPVLEGLAKKKDFSVIDKSYLQPGETWPWFQINSKAVPNDVLNFSKVTLLSHNASQNASFMAMDSDKIPVNLDQGQMHALMARLEKEGLKNAEKEAQGLRLATQLKETMTKLQPMTIQPGACPPHLSPTILFDILRGAKVSRPPLPQPQRDFSIAAQKTGKGKKVFYAQAKSQPPKAGK